MHNVAERLDPRLKRTEKICIALAFRLHVEPIGEWIAFAWLLFGALLCFLFAPLPRCAFSNEPTELLPESYWEFLELLKKVMKPIGRRPGRCERGSRRS